MGIQDFQLDVQKAVHRLQPFEMTRDLLSSARRLGFDSINVDLIYGLPYQTPESFAHTVDQIIGLSPDRIALFSYAHVPWLKKQQGSFIGHLPEGMVKFEIFRTGLLNSSRPGTCTSAWTTLRNPAMSFRFPSKGGRCTAIFRATRPKRAPTCTAWASRPSAASNRLTRKTIATSLPGKKPWKNAVWPLCAAIIFPKK